MSDYAPPHDIYSSPVPPPKDVYPLPDGYGSPPAPMTGGSP